MKDTQIITQIKQRDSAAFEIIYKFYYPVVENFVKKNNGTTDDVKGVFQETVLVLLNKIPDESFELTSSLKTYIFSIASHIWLKRLREASRLVRETEPFEIPAVPVSELDICEEVAHQESLIRRVFRQITRPCVILLSRIFLNEIKREKLMQNMGYKNTHSFDNQKYKCLEQARKTSHKK